MVPSSLYLFSLFPDVYTFLTLKSKKQGNMAEYEKCSCSAKMSINYHKMQNIQYVYSERNKTLHKLYSSCLSG